MKKNTYYLHSAIPYVNAAPHAGHAQEFVYADVIKRFQQLQGFEVLLLCGADENALKIVQASQKAGQEPLEFCDSHNAEFLDLAKKLNVNFDIWQRGSDKFHHFPASQKLWELCQKNGDIYKKSYSGLYCVGCEAFYTKDELNEAGDCYEHPGKKLENITEENYFFRLSKYQTFIEDLITKDGLHITPATKKNEVLAFIKRGLDDFSISRSRERAKNWGVPVPGDDAQIMYVWFDALNIYQSGIGFGWDEATYEKWWPSQVMVIGKGITRFHAVYWPAILKSAGLKIPKKLFVHGYLTVDGQKMSKTLGNVVDPVSIIEKFGTDAVRYYLLREIPSFKDGDFSERRFKELYNADLANGLGNLVARTSKLCEKITLPDTFKPQQDILYVQLVQEFKFDEALAHIWEQIKTLDQYINESKPWKITETEELTQVLTHTVSGILIVANQLQPFLPSTAEKIISQFSQKHVTPQPSLFPRLI